MITIKTNMGFLCTLPDSAADCAVEMLEMNYRHEKTIMSQRHEKEMKELQVEHERLLAGLADRGFGGAEDGEQNG